MRIRQIIKYLRKKIKGNLQVAIEEGLIAEAGVSVMKNVDFGSEPYLIILRKNCRITGDVVFVTHDGGTWAFRNSFPEYSDVIKYGTIEIGENSFIGTRSIILPGVKIGKNCVIGAGSVVNKDIPDYTVVAGVPAKPICSLEEYADKSQRVMSDYDRKEYMKDKKHYLIEYFNMAGKIDD